MTKSSLKILCPACSKSDQVFKVSSIYLAGVETRQPSFLKKKQEGQSSLAKEQVTGFSSQQLISLSRKLSPPSSGRKAPVRSIHPDWVVGAFSLIVPVFLVGIFNQQRNLFLPVLAILIGFYGFYFFKRKAVIARFEHRIAAEKEKQTRIERLIALWMKLYYCSCEDGVFLPGKDKLVPVDQVTWYLMEEAK
jgi:hypothetical protein